MAARRLPRQQLVDADRRQAQSATFPESSFGYSQNIEDNIEEALSGVKGVNAIKVYGPDLVR